MQGQALCVRCEVDQVSWYHAALEYAGTGCCVELPAETPNRMDCFTLLLKIQSTQRILPLLRLLAILEQLLGLGLLDA